MAYVMNRPRPDTKVTPTPAAVDAASTPANWILGDAGSTAAVARTMGTHQLQAKGIHAGGFDLLPTTLEAVAKGDLDFTIDQQPYLQGFYTVMELFIYKISGGLTGPSDINTGLNFVTKANVDPFLHTESRFQGNSADHKVLTRSGPI